MGFKVQKEVVSRGVAIFQTVLETAQGGFTLDATGLATDYIIPGGSPIGYDESTRKAVLIKTATLQASATNSDTTYRVLKGHSFKVGDYLASAVGSKAYAISAIDTSNAAYDTLTVGTTLAATLAAGAPLFQSATTGASNSSLFVAPKGLLYQDTHVSANQDVAVVVRGTVYARRVPGLTAEIKTALPLIIFSQSY